MMVEIIKMLREMLKAAVSVIIILGSQYLQSHYT